MFTRVMTCAVVASVLAAPAALADPKHGQPYGSWRGANAGYDYARVLHVEPIVRQVRVDVPRRECWTETRYDQPQRSYSSLAGPTIVGGLIGGAIGHQFGSGRGKSAATVAGVLIGSALGHDAGARRQAQYGYSQPQPQAYQVERCDQRIEQTYEERIDGYQVDYEYCGQRYSTRLPYDPGERLRVQVEARPA